jgi:hypothetical protein
MKSDKKIGEAWTVVTSVGFAVLLMVLIVTTLVHIVTYELGGFVVSHSLPWHRITFVFELILIVVSIVLFVLRLKGRLLTLPLLWGLTSAALLLLVWAIDLAFQSGYPESGIWCMVQVSLWGGGHEIKYVIHPLVEFAFPWLLFVTWVDVGLGSPERIWRRLVFLGVCWGLWIMLTIVISGLPKPNYIG